MKLYEFAPTRSIRVRWTLQELGVPFEPITVNLVAGDNRKPEYLKINPAGKLPALVDGETVLTESIAIVLYLAEKYPDKKLVPTELRQRAELNRWLLFTTTELEQPLWRISRHTNIYPPEKRLPGDVAIARDEFTAMAKVLEQHMQGREFVVGDSVTVADFVLGYTTRSIGRRWWGCSRGYRPCRPTCCGCTHDRTRRCASRTPSPASAASRRGAATSGRSRRARASTPPGIRDCRCRRRLSASSAR